MLFDCSTATEKWVCSSGSVVLSDSALCVVALCQPIATRPTQRERSSSAVSEHDAVLWAFPGVSRKLRLELFCRGGPVSE